MKVRHVHSILAILAIFLAPARSSSAATVSAVVIARDGIPSPDGNGSFGTYFNYGEPCVNNAGQVAFSCRLTGTTGGSLDNDVICRGARSGTAVLVAREGQPIPDGPGLFGGLHLVPRQYAMNDSGRIVFMAPLAGTAGGTADNAALYSAIDPGVYWEYTRRGGSVPYTPATMNGIYTPQINNQPPAAVAFYASLGTSSVPGVIYTSRLGVLSPVSYITQPAPDATAGSGLNGTLFAFPFAGSDAPALRTNATEVAFYAHAAATSLAPYDDDGIYRASPDGIADMARGNQSAPGGGTYQEFSSSPVYNANGIGAFGAYLKPVPSAGEVIALDWPFGGDVVAYSSQSAADGNGMLHSFYAPSINNHEAVAYKVSLNGTAGGGFDDVAIYKGDSSILVVPPLEDQIAREDQIVPGGNGRFADFGNVTAINDAGEVLFIATMRGTSGGAADNRALYLWDPHAGLVALLRLGQVIDGRHVIDFSTLTESDFGGYRVLNDAGEAVARVRFSEPGGDGIYLFRLEGLLAVEPPHADPGLALAVGPNPVGRGPLTVRWAMRRPDASARLRVLDAAGRRVRSLASGAAMAAEGGATWDLADDAGRPAAPGIYVILLETSQGTRARRVACVR